MKTSKSHEALVTGQFGPRAAAYVTSQVHAKGEDLQRLVEVVTGQAAARVLDLGCGGGHVSFHVAPQVGEVVAYDLSAEMLSAVIEEARRRKLSNIVAERGAAERLPFPDASFDFVFSRFSIHHWHDAKAGIREARRVLKPAGRAVFIDAVTPGRPLLDTYLQSIELLRDPSHVRNYSGAEWHQAMAEAGFAPVSATRRRLPLDFAAWVERMQTPEIHVQAIRSLQASMSAEVIRHFDIRADGSFTLDTLTLEAVPA
jgi:ubiquinone/menaquinone biosynthesis C-methylase UbiE